MAPEVRVNAVAPGVVRTPMFERSAREDPSMEERVASRVPLRRLARPEDIGAATAFLLSDDASYITGTELVVDGGWTVGGL
jgi:NAD(P)-dependent dehydrogenase (short-subunit alcohol dehydrogenase family)